MAEFAIEPGQHGKVSNQYGGLCPHIPFPTGHNVNPPNTFIILYSPTHNNARLNYILRVSVTYVGNRLLMFNLIHRSAMAEIYYQSLSLSRYWEGPAAFIYLGQRRKKISS